jgi:hypothetical protein
VDGWLVDRFWLRLRTFILSNPATLNSTI